MFAAKLVQLIETHADKLADNLMQNLNNSPRCPTLLQRVPPDELKRRAHEIYRHLAEWLSGKTSRSAISVWAYGVPVKGCRSRRRIISGNTYSGKA